MAHQFLAEDLFFFRRQERENVDTSLGFSRSKDYEKESLGLKTPTFWNHRLNDQNCNMENKYLSK